MLSEMKHSEICLFPSHTQCRSQTQMVSGTANGKGKKQQVCEEISLVERKEIAPTCLSLSFCLSSVCKKVCEYVVVLFCTREL